MIVFGACRLWGTRWDRNPNKPALLLQETSFPFHVKPDWWLVICPASAAPYPALALCHQEHILRVYLGLSQSVPESDATRSLLNPLAYWLLILSWFITGGYSMIMAEIRYLLYRQIWPLVLWANTVNLGLQQASAMHKENSIQSFSWKLGLPWFLSFLLRVWSRESLDLKPANIYQY